MSLTNLLQIIPFSFLVRKGLVPPQRVWVFSAYRFKPRDAVYSPAKVVIHLFWKWNHWTQIISIKPCLSHVLGSMLLVTWVSLWCFPTAMFIVCWWWELKHLVSKEIFQVVYTHVVSVGRSFILQPHLCGWNFQPPQHKRKNRCTMSLGIKKIQPERVCEPNRIRVAQVPAQSDMPSQDLDPCCQPEA